jgi:hypothetical protein
LTNTQVFYGGIVKVNHMWESGWNVIALNLLFPIFGIYGECTVVMENIDLEILTNLHFFCPSKIRKKEYWLCKIWGFHGGDYEECRLLGCYAVWVL